MEAFDIILKCGNFQDLIHSGYDRQQVKSIEFLNLHHFSSDLNFSADMVVNKKLVRAANSGYLTILQPDYLLCQPENLSQIMADQKGGGFLNFMYFQYLILQQGSCCGIQ